jgi:hypothetical protein
VVEVEPIGTPAPVDTPTRPATTVRVQSPIDAPAAASADAAAWPPPVDPDATPPPAPDETELAWADIRREAARIEAERAELRGLKDEALARQDLAAREEERDERTDYLRRVRQALGAGGQGLAALAGPTAGYADLQGDEAARRASLARSRQLRLAWIARLRGRGVPEGAILEEIAQAHAMNVNARGGPRTRLDTLRRSAAELLAVPLDAGDPGGASWRPIARPRRPPRAVPGEAPHGTTHGLSRRRTAG